MRGVLTVKGIVLRMDVNSNSPKSYSEMVQEEIESINRILSDNESNKDLYWVGVNMIVILKQIMNKSWRNYTEHLSLLLDISSFFRGKYILLTFLTFLIFCWNGIHETTH